jgi:hypothetical protein
MMNQLIDTVAQKTGLSADMAKVAVDTVLGLLKTKLPSPLASQLDSLVGEGESGGEQGEGLTGKAGTALGSLFHKDS